MSYYKVCPYCGAHLDHGEKCDCSQSMYQLKTDEDINAMSREEKLQYAYDLLMMIPADKIKEILAPYAERKGVEL